LLKLFSAAPTMTTEKVVVKEEEEEVVGQEQTLKMRQGV
jgi:hypothetical protein